MNHIEDIQRNPIRSVFTISIPIIAILFLQTFYSVIDAYWISGLGTEAVIAVGYVLNLWYGLQKLGEGIGRSCSVLISNSFGEKDWEHANNVAFHGFIMILALSIIYPLIFLMLTDKICALGHLEQYTTLIFEYFLIPSIFIIFVLLTNYFSSVLSSEGDTKRVAYIVILGNILNIILDPILIYNLNMGIFGAGLATTIGCIVSFSIFYYIFYIRGDAITKLDRRHFSCDRRIFKEIIELAVPLILNGFILMVLGLLINYSIHVFSNPIISFGYIVILRIQTLMFTPIQGISQGVCIVTAHLAGSKRFKTLKSTVKKSILITMIFASLFAVIYMLTYADIISLFSDDLKVRQAVGSLIVFSIVSFFLQPPVRICNYSFVGLKKSSYTLLSLILNVSLFVVFMLTGTLVLGGREEAIFTGVVLADVFQIILMGLLLQKMLKKHIENDEGTPE